MKTSFLWVSALILSLTACDKKEDEPSNITPTIANISGSYKLTGTTINGADVFGQYAACEKDDVHSLVPYFSPETSGTYTVTDAGAVCFPTTQNSGTWVLLSATSLDLNGVTYNIASFNGKTLVLAFNFGGATYTDTYTRQ